MTTANAGQTMNEDLGFSSVVSGTRPAAAR
jgi:hypothetical protein